MNVEFENVKPYIGAIVHAERSALFDKAVAQACMERLEERGVLIFPRVAFDDAEQVAFTEALGERINFNQRDTNAEGISAEVYKVSLDREDAVYVRGTFFWHMDGMSVDIPPPKATLLSARRVAPKGGQTEFANTLAAWAQLPDEEKAELEGLRVIHSVAASIAPVMEDVSPRVLENMRTAIMERPLVWTLPSGRKALLVGTTADRIVDMPLPEGRALLTRLLEWAGQRQFCYRHDWQEGDLVLWNNCGVLHRVIPYDRESKRMMHRTSLAGVAAPV